jgi:glycosyltransferase involved in cell wall biosynthesis
MLSNEAHYSGVSRLPGAGEYRDEPIVSGRESLSPPERLTRRRILVSAFAVSPCRGSEPGSGWNMTLRLAAYHDVTVLCATEVPGEPYRDEIRDYFRVHGAVPGLRFEFVDLPTSAGRFIRRTGNTPLGALRYYTAYNLWQRAAYVRAQQLHREHPFDLAYQLTLTGFREPGYLWKLGIPFIWGPIGGAVNMPWSYMRIMRWRERLYYGLRNLVNTTQKRMSLRSRRAAKSARMIWVTDNSGHQLVRHQWNCPEPSILPDAGTSPSPMARIRDYDGTRPLRVVWSGVHRGRKALPILLYALAVMERPAPVEVTVLGTGAASAAWKDLARRLRVDGCIRWTGQLTQQAAVGEVARADVLVFTSLLEGTPHTVLEALSLGVPVVCHDACGMGVVVTDDCGMKIPPRGPDFSIRAFADAIGRFQAEPAEVQRLSAGAIRRADELSWDARAAIVADAVDHIVPTKSANDESSHD